MVNGPWDMRNEAVLKLLGIPDVATLVLKRQAQWLGHVARMPTERITRAALFGTIPGRVSLIGSDSKGWRKGRYSTQALRVLDFMPGVLRSASLFLRRRADVLDYFSPT